MILVYDGVFNVFINGTEMINLNVWYFESAWLFYVKIDQFTDWELLSGLWLQLTFVSCPPHLSAGEIFCIFVSFLAEEIVKGNRTHSLLHFCTCIFIPSCILLYFKYYDQNLCIFLYL